MNKKKKPTKDQIEKMVMEIYSFLVKNDLWYDTCILYNGKKMTSSLTNDIGDGKRFEVIGGVEPGDILEYYNHDHIISMIFEGPLYHVINGYRSGSEKIVKKLEKIFNKYGCWSEHGYAWSLTLYQN